MEIIKNLCIYGIKSLYYSGLLILPTSLILIFFKRINRRVKYNIALVTLILIPVIPFIQIPEKVNNSLPVTGINILYSDVVNQPITTISNIQKESNIVLAESRVINSTESTLGFNNPPPSNIQLKLIIPFVIYLIIMLTLIYRLINSMLLLKKKMKSAIIITDQSTTQVADQVYSKLNYRKKINLININGISSPFSFGLVNKFIVLPYDIVYTNKELTQILMHETSHVVRRDYIVTLLQRAIETILFFNPLVWFLSFVISSSREMICDEQVIKHSDSRESYAKVLLNTAMRTVTGSPMFCNGSVGNKKELTKRIDNIVNEKKEYKHRVYRLLQIGLFILSTSLLLFIGCTNSERSTIPLNKDVLGINEDINELIVKSKSFPNQLEIDSSLKKIENIETNLRKKIGSQNRRNLAYLLMYKAKLLNFSIMDYYDEDIYWSTFPKINNHLRESLELINKYGDEQDKGNIYYETYRLFLFIDDSQQYLEEASIYFKDAGDKARSAQTTLELVNYDLSPTNLKKYQNDLDTAKNWAVESGDFGILTTLNSLDKIIGSTTGIIKNYRLYGWGCFTLDKSKNEVINIINTNGFLNSTDLEGMPEQITSTMNIFEIMYAITGQLYVPSSGDILKENIKMQPFSDSKTEVRNIETGVDVETEVRTYSDAVKITFDYVLDESVNKESWFQNFQGINEFWYVKGIGIVKYYNSYENTTIFLSDYTVENDLTSYLPLGEGNRWVYSVEGYNARRIKWVYEVEYTNKEKIFLSHYGFEKYVKPEV